MVEHTPGPWEVEDDLHTPCVTADAADGTEWIIADLGLPCDLVGLNPENLAKSILDERDANARLIAAAPCMLADAIEAERMFRWYGDMHAAKPDPEKAARNYEMADRLAATIARTKSLTSKEEG